MIIVTKQCLSVNSIVILCYAISMTGNSCGLQKNVIYIHFLPHVALRMPITFVSTANDC